MWEIAQLIIELNEYQLLTYNLNIIALTSKKGCEHLFSFFAVFLISNAALHTSHDTIITYLLLA